MRVPTSQPEHRAALMARIETLEGQATALEADDTVKEEALTLIEVLRRAREALTVDPFAAANVERALDTTSRSLASLGRST